MSKRNYSQATKRHIFLFCWWLGLVVIGSSIWTVIHLSIYDLGYLESLIKFINPFFIVQSFLLWVFLKKYFSNFNNWIWVVIMPLVAFIGTIFSILYIVGGIMALLGGRG